MHILDCLDLKYTFTQGCTESAVPGEIVYVYITENLCRCMVLGTRHAWLCLMSTLQQHASDSSASIWALNHDDQQHCLWRLHHRSEHNVCLAMDHSTAFTYIHAAAAYLALAGARTSQCSLLLFMPLQSRAPGQDRLTPHFVGKLAKGTYYACKGWMRQKGECPWQQTWHDATHVIPIHADMVIYCISRYKLHALCYKFQKSNDSFQIC